MVLRILKNPVYIGVLEQGRVTTPSYKVKRLVQKPRDEWAIVENHHEPIISRLDFDTVQRIVAMDTRTLAAGQPVELFSGMVYCGECGGAMVRKTVPSGRKKFTYYVCATHKTEKTCYSHALRVEALADMVLAELQRHIQNVIDLAELMKLTDTAKLQQANVQKVQARLVKKQEEIDRCQRLLRSLYENLADGIIDKNEYQELKSTYQNRRAEAEEQAEFLREEMGKELNHSANDGWMEQFARHKNIEALDRRIVVSLIERVLIYRDHRVELVYRWHNEFEWQKELVEQAQKLLSEKEAV